MAIRPSPSDRFGPLRPKQAGLLTRLKQKAVALLVYALLLPATLLALLWAGVYVVTGDSPLEMLQDITSQTLIDMPMPPRPGGDLANAPLMQPPAHTNDSDVKMETAEEPKPEAAKAPEEPPKAVEPPKPEEPAKPDEHKAEPPPVELPPEGPKGPALATPEAAPTIQEPLVPPGGDPLAAPAFSKLPTRSDLKALLSPYPLPELLKTSPNGPLPITAIGKEARSAYARPFSGDAASPRIAVVVVGLGLSKEATEAAIIRLPPEVTLSFSPYATNLDGWIKRARSAGHEVMLDLPLEPPNYPAHDSGTLSVLSSQTPLDVISHLESVLGKTTGYIGLAGSLRSPVVTGPQWPILLRAIRNRGLLYLGDGLAGVSQSDAPPSASVTLVPDESPFRAAIDVRLSRLMSAAMRDQMAVAYVSPLPVTMERLLAWFDSFPQRGVVLAPASALVRPLPGQTTSSGALPPSSLDEHDKAPAKGAGAKHE